MKSKWLWPLVLALVFAITRIPNLMPPNFSAAYAFIFCAGVYFPKKLVWWLPLGTMFATDLLLNSFYYHPKYNAPILGAEMIGNYSSYILVLLLGRFFGKKASFLSLLGGGLLGAILFYFVSNFISWLFNPFHNPEYTKTLHGLLVALTLGTGGWPQTWEFFKNTLTSSGLFTGLFVGAMKLLEAIEPAEEEEPSDEPEEAPQDQPEEAKA